MNSVNINQTSNRILREKEVVVRTGLSRSTIYAKMNPRSKYYDPTFPKNVPLAAKAKGWKEHEINAWIDSRIDTADIGHQPHHEQNKEIPKKQINNPEATDVSTEEIYPYQQIAEAKTHAGGRSLKEEGKIGETIFNKLKDCFRLKIWTPAMAAMIVCGIMPKAGCKAIPNEAIGFDQELLKPTDERLRQARHILEEWNYVDEEDEGIVFPPTSVSPLEFIIWCYESNIQTPWLSLINDLMGNGTETTNAIKQVYLDQFLDRPYIRNQSNRTYNNADNNMDKKPLEERNKRIHERKKELIRLGSKCFIKTIAEEEDLSQSSVKLILRKGT